VQVTGSFDGSETGTNQRESIMNTGQQHPVLSLRELHAWLVERGLVAQFPGIAMYARALETRVGEIRAVVEERGTYLEVSTSAAAEARQRRQELLLHHMRPIEEAARLAVPQVVQVTPALRMPPQGVDADALVAAAQAMARAAGPYRKLLVKEGLARTFVARLKDAADSYDEAIATRAMAIELSRRTGASIDSEMGRARGLVESFAWMPEQVCQNDPAALAEWRRLVTSVRRQYRAA
jgi:hypothetical protein